MSEMHYSTSHFSVENMNSAPAPAPAVASIFKCVCCTCAQCEPAFCLPGQTVVRSLTCQYGPVFMNIYIVGRFLVFPGTDPFISAWALA